MIVRKGFKVMQSIDGAVNIDRSTPGVKFHSGRRGVITFNAAFRDALEDPDYVCVDVSEDTITIKPSRDMRDFKVAKTGKSQRRICGVAIKKALGVGRDFEGFFIADIEDRTAKIIV